MQIRNKHKRRNKNRHHRQLRDMSINPCEGLAPQALALIQQRMAMYDNLGPEEAALVQEFGLRLGIEAGRLFYGRWREARAYCLSRQKHI